MDLKPLIKKSFLFIAVVATFCCYSRADYNLPLYAFGYVLWDLSKPSQKVRLTYLFLFSTFMDFIWLCYWGSFWDSSIYKHAFSKGVHSFVIALSIINFLVKLVSNFVIITTEADVKHAVSPEGFIENVKFVAGIDRNNQPYPQN